MLDKTKQFVFAILLASVISVFFVSDSFAYTTSISTFGPVNVDASAAGDSASLGTDTIRVNSTCPLGYTVSINGPADNTLYQNGDNTSSNIISASTGTKSNPVSILGNNLGTWGYTTDDDATINSSFIGLTNTETLLFSKDAASEVTGDYYSIFYGVSVTPTTAPGIYTLAESSQGAEDNVIVYSLLPNVNCVDTVIRYNDNGANSPTTMGIIHNVEEDDEVTLAASNYRRAGYGFAGWSTIQLNPDSASFKTDLTAAKAAGKVFGPNETITVNSTIMADATLENNVQYITMYAIWVKPVGGATLQNWKGCGGLNIGDVAALTDERDSQVYSVARLADGNCWTIENLRLETANSADASKAQGFGGVFTGLADAETDNFSNSTVANSKYSTANIIGDYQGYRIPRYRNDNTNLTVSNMTAASENVYGYGNYYNWAATKANTTSFSGIASTAAETNTSLCPAGWKLPYGKNTGYGNAPGGYYYLNYKINNDSNLTNATASKRIRAYPNNFVYAGYATNGSAINSRGTFDYYWTASLYDGIRGYVLAISDSSVGTGNGTFNTHIGGSIRCTIEPTNTYLYDEVIKEVKTSGGQPQTQSAADLKVAITTPTSNDPSIDTSNSGLFLYNASVFGAASDASNDYPIYYYRGILDSNLDGTTSTYGSNGDGAYYPNYVRMGDTCWRIVRTTGSGGIKMIFNGLYGATNAGTCANTQWKTTTNNSSVFYNQTNSSGASNIVYVGYTYDSARVNYSGSHIYGEMFGTNSNNSNNTSSTIKGHIENNWFSNISRYESILEASAGYCADRTLYDTTSTLIGDNDIIVYPSGKTLYFGGYLRNRTSGSTLSLTCPRGVVDLYTTTEAGNGNHQLNKPAALLTMDEAALAGSGSSNGSSVSNANSYLRSGSDFYLLTPDSKYGGSYAYISSISASGNPNRVYLYSSAGARPVVSLNHSTAIYDGTGTATDPWIIATPNN